MMLVFRVEHKSTRLGAYQHPSEISRELAALAAKQRSLRAPGDDGLYLASVPWAYVFGCDSLLSLKRWVLLGRSVDDNSRILSELDAEGFVVKEYLVESTDVVHSVSGTQLMFYPDHELVGEHGCDILMQESPMVFSVVG